MTRGKLLVCGGTGFIGERLVRELVNEGREVRVLVHKQVPPWKGAKERIELVQGNILDAGVAAEAVDGVQVVVNLVGAYFENLYETNIRTSYNLLEGCRKRHIRRILFASSTMVYGECKDKPAEESDPPRPSTEYALTKYLAETMHSLYSDTYGLPVTIVRLANTYGPGKRAGVVYNFLRASLQNTPIMVNDDGKQKRDLLYVDDAVQGIKRALDYESRRRFEVFNIGGAQLVSVLELASLVEKLGKKRGVISFGACDVPDVSCSWSSYRKAQRLLGYAPEVGIEEGVGKTLDYVRHLLKGEPDGKVL